METETGHNSNKKAASSAETLAGSAKQKLPSLTGRKKSTPSKSNHELESEKSSTIYSTSKQSVSIKSSSAKTVGNDKHDKPDKHDKLDKHKKKEWDRYFSFINDKEREKLMQLPDIENKSSAESSKTRRKKVKSLSVSSKSGLKSDQEQDNTNASSTNVASNVSNRSGSRKSSSSSLGDSQRSVHEADEARGAETEPKTNAPNKIRFKNLSKRKEKNYFLDNFNFNQDLDNRNARKVATSSGVKKSNRDGYVYYRSMSMRNKCEPNPFGAESDADENESRPRFLQETDESLRYKTSHNNLLRSLRANL